MPNKVAFLFPGQGAQYPGMGKDFASAFSAARETFEEADDILHEPLSKIIFEGPESELTRTKSAQTAIFVTSAAMLRTLQSQFPTLSPAATAGLSLGEYTALWASGRLSFQETILLIRRRAEFMDDACEKIPGTMAAVLGLEGAVIESAVRDIPGVPGVPSVWIANYNCPGQIVISGTEAGIEAATPALKERGAKRVILLQVHGAFHSGLMKPAQERLAPFIAKAPLVDSQIEFAMNAPGDFVSNVDEIRQQLTLQVTSSVRWEQSVRAMHRRGYELYLEIGCGKTLSGFNRKMGFSALSLEKIEDLEKIAKEIEVLV